MSHPADCAPWHGHARRHTARLVSALIVAASGAPGRGIAQESAAPVDVAPYVEAYQTAWNTHDAAALSRFFAADADMVMYNQPIARGRAAIVDFWRSYFEAQEPERRGSFEITGTSSVSAGVALVDIASTTSGTGPSGDALVTRRARGTWLLRRQDGTWIIEAMRGFPTEEDAVELNDSREEAEALRPQIRGLIADYQEAFNRHDADAVAAFFRPDADLVVRESPGISGLRQIREWWHEYFARPRPYRALLIVDRIRMITEDAALVNVIGTGAIPGRHETVEPIRTTRATWILAREAGEWRIAALRVLPGESDRVLRASSR